MSDLTESQSAAQRRDENPDDEATLQDDIQAALRKLRRSWPPFKAKLAAAKAPFKCVVCLILSAILTVIPAEMLHSTVRAGLTVGLVYYALKWRKQYKLRKLAQAAQKLAAERSKETQRPEASEETPEAEVAEMPDEPTPLPEPRVRRAQPNSWLPRGGTNRQKVSVAKLLEQHRGNTSD